MIPCNNINATPNLERNISNQIHSMWHQKLLLKVHSYHWNETKWNNYLFISTIEIYVEHLQPGEQPNGENFQWVANSNRQHNSKANVWSKFRKNDEHLKSDFKSTSESKIKFVKINEKKEKNGINNDVRTGKVGTWKNNKIVDRINCTMPRMVV